MTGTRTAVTLFSWFGAVISLLVNGCDRARPSISSPTTSLVSAEATSEQVHELCGACHRFPPPDSFPRSAWKGQVQQAYEFLKYPPRNNPAVLQQLVIPPKDQVLRYFERRAPVALPVLVPETSDRPTPVAFERMPLSDPMRPPHPVVSNVNLVHLSDPHKLDLLVCDMRDGRVMALKPYEPSPTWRLLGEVSHPAHAEVVDLDGDGILDILVADLGSFEPTDAHCGSVVWLRGDATGNFTAIPLLQGVGRVADVQAADFRGIGRLDLVVAVFGWRRTGEILYLENRTTDWAHPVFVPHVLDERTGGIHVPVADLNGDGRPDFVALISQEHETVVAFINEGVDGDDAGRARVLPSREPRLGGSLALPMPRFRKETVYQAPHPAYGSTGIQLVDLDGDGRLDVLYTNGDVFDDNILKPYHGIHWLQNEGRFPFHDHLLTSMYGIHRAVAADFQGTGRSDIVAVSFLPAWVFPMRRKMNLDAVVYLEQTAPGQFVRHSLEAVTCDHPTCAAGAWDGDGRVHLAVGNACLFDQDRVTGSVTLWRNLGPPKRGQGKAD